MWFLRGCLATLLGAPALFVSASLVAKALGRQDDSVMVTAWVASVLVGLGGVSVSIAGLVRWVAPMAGIPAAGRNTKLGALAIGLAFVVLACVALGILFIDV